MDDHLLRVDSIRGTKLGCCSCCEDPWSPSSGTTHSTRRIGRTDGRTDTDDDIAYRERERDSRLLNTAHIQSKHRNLMDRQNPLAITADTLRASRTRCKKGRGRETRNSSGDEIVNVNFIYDDIVHAL